MSNTKIIVVKRKQVILAAIIALAVIILTVVIVSAAGSDTEETENTVMLPEDDAVYRAGVYNRMIRLGDHTVNLELVLDESHINGVNLVNIDEAVTTMYPLLYPCLATISEQLSGGLTPEEIVLADESRYTGRLLLDTIGEMLDSAIIDDLYK